MTMSIQSQDFQKCSKIKNATDVFIIHRCLINTNYRIRQSQTWREVLLDRERSIALL